MKPDNIKKRRPDNHYGKWKQGQIVKSKELDEYQEGPKVDRPIQRSIHSTHISRRYCCFMMEWYGFSLRKMIGELHHRSGSRKAVGLKHVPSKSWLYKWRNGLPMDRFFCIAAWWNHDPTC